MSNIFDISATRSATHWAECTSKHLVTTSKVWSYGSSSFHTATRPVICSFLVSLLVCEVEDLECDHPFFNLM